MEDIAYLGNATSSLEDHLQDEFGTRMRFGCQTSETGLFRTQKADGIMGMADFGTFDGYLVLVLMLCRNCTCAAFVWRRQNSA